MFVVFEVRYFGVRSKTSGCCWYVVDLRVPPKIPFGLMFLPNWICFGDVGFSSVRHKIVSWDLNKDESRV